MIVKRRADARLVGSGTGAPRAASGAHPSAAPYVVAARESPRQRGADARGFRDLVLRRCRSRESEPNRLRSAFFLAGPTLGISSSGRRERSFRPLLAVEAHREPVRLIAQVLQDEQRLGAPRDHQRLGSTGK